METERERTLPRRLSRSALKVRQRPPLVAVVLSFAVHMSIERWCIQECITYIVNCIFMP